MYCWQLNHRPDYEPQYTINTTKPTKNETLLILQDLVGGETTVWEEFLNNKVLQYNFQDRVRGDDFGKDDRKNIRRHGIGLLFVAAHLRAAKNCAHTVVDSWRLKTLLVADALGIFTWA